MGRLWPVLRREYLERVRSRSFLIATIAAPLLLGGVMLLPALMMSRQYGRPLRVAVLDASGSLGDAVAEALAQQKMDGRARFAVEKAEGGDADEQAARLKKDILSGRLDGYLYFAIEPRRLQAWREANELAGRQLMRDGQWVV